MKSNNEVQGRKLKLYKNSVTSWTESTENLIPPKINMTVRSTKQYLANNYHLGKLTYLLLHTIHNTLPKAVKFREITAQKFDLHIYKNWTSTIA